MQGARADQLRDAALRRGQPVPDAIANRPELEEDLAGAWNVFHDLSSCRAMGYGMPGPIPWLAFDAWCVRYEIELPLADYLWDLVKEMDTAYLEHVAEKLKKGGR